MSAAGHPTGAEQIPAEDRAALALLAGAWWVALVVGVLNVIAALVVLIEPHTSLLAIALVVGIYLVIAGALILGAGLARSRDRWPVIVFGILAIIAGLLVIDRPGSAVHGVRIVFGIYLVISGLSHLGLAASIHGYRGTEIGRGVLELIAGVVFLVAPALGLAAIALFFGVYLLLRGVLEVTFALALRRAGHALGSG